MKPNATANHVLSTTRAMAKMHEFRVAQEDFIALPRDPAVLFNLAIGILGDVASEISRNPEFQEGRWNVDSIPTPASWTDDNSTSAESMQFASKFFDAVLNSKLNNTLTFEFSVLCAAAYYIAGNVGSASVVARQITNPELEMAGGLGCLIRALILNDFREIEGDHALADFTSAVLIAMHQYSTLEADGEGVLNACKELRYQAYDNGSSRELLYSDIVTGICLLKLRNSARNILPASSTLPLNLWRTAITKSHFPFELWPAQQRIANSGLLSGGSALIQMPTSAGKTRATELIIRSAFLSQRATLAIIVAPFRSLCHDIRSDLTLAFSGEPVNLDEVSDSYQLDLNFDDLYIQNSVLILTPEKLLYMLRRAPELIERIGLIIYDEGHQFDGLTRGPTYELLLTSLRLLLRKDTQVILISAVIGNASEVANWLLGDPNAVIDGVGLLPTTKSIAFASWQTARGILNYVNPTNPDEREFFVPRILQEILLNRRPRERVDKFFPEKNSGGDIGLFLGLHVVNNGSVAIFCGRKDSAAKICKRAVEIFDRGIDFQPPRIVSNGAEIEKIRVLSEHNLGANTYATQSAALGILAHHSDTPHGLRLSIEYAMKENLAKFVVCTSTLAQGVNFPLKYLIVTSTRQGEEQILVRDFHNLIGRAGRAGMHTEGSVIFSTPAIYDNRRGSPGRWVWSDVRALLDPSNSEPSTSSILTLFDSYSRKISPRDVVTLELLPRWLDLAFADNGRITEIVQEALEIEPLIDEVEFRKFIETRARVVQSIASFLASNITFDNDDAEEIRYSQVDALVAHTLAFHTADDDSRTRLTNLFRSISNSLITNTDVPQREIIRRSPLPPSIVSLLQEWLFSNFDELILAAPLNDDSLFNLLIDPIFNFCSARAFRGLSNTDLLPQALRGWITGHSFSTIFIPFHDADIRVGRSRIDVDDIVSICESGFGYDIAMIVASISDLAEPLDRLLSGALSKIQRQIKYGLNSQAALTFYEAGFADRYVALMLSLVWPDIETKDQIRDICRTEEGLISELLSELPTYFKNVALELSRA